MILRFVKEARTGWSIWSVRTWTTVGGWMFLGLICWEMLREHSVLSVHLAEAIQRKEVVPLSPSGQGMSFVVATDVGDNSSVTQSASESNKFDVPSTENEKEVYATFLSTRIGNNSELGEFEHDWYFNSTRVLIHRLLRNPETRTHRRVVVLSLSRPTNRRS
jgi:hypothetical protein